MPADGDSVHAGIGAELIFRGMDQSDVAVQAKLLEAWEVALNSRWISRESSPGTSWLTELHTFAARTQPDAANEDGTVAQAQFYSLLSEFLEEQVRAHPAQRCSV